MQKSMVGLAVLWAGLAAGSRAATVVDFEKDTPGAPPAGFTTALTGSGKAGVWVVVDHKTAPSGHLVLAQTAADPTGYRLPLCVLDSVTAKDAEISVKLKPISGREDQPAGIVWRYRDKDSYYIVRANALEGNVVLPGAGKIGLWTKADSVIRFDDLRIATH
jgi:hypothetical protein